MRSCRVSSLQSWIAHCLTQSDKNPSPNGPTARSCATGPINHLLAGLLFDDAGHRMIPTHATKAGIRYRYYVSMPVLHGEAKTASAGSVSRVPAADIEDALIKFLKEHLAAN